MTQKIRMKLIYPRWEKLQGQTTFNLPPHGPVVFAAALPERVEVSFTDENVEAVDFEESCDLVAISMMLSTQVKRGWTIAAEFRKRGKKVIFGGISTMLHAEETMEHGDAVFLGEAEGRMEELIGDWEKNQLKKVYNYMGQLPPIELVGPARRDLYKKELYNHKGVQMVDLFHASRGCRFNCYPCAVSYLGGRHFRPRPFDKVVEELAGIENNRLFIVDNSLAQNKEWEIQLFKEMIPMKKKWISHTIEDDPKILDLAAQAGAWYVYQAVFDTSDYIKERIRRYHDYGIGVEGTILLGLDNQSEDDMRRLIDFLLEIDLDLAEFTILTPFPHTKAFDDLMRKGRIVDYDWDHYNAGQVVYKPAQVTPEKLQELYEYAWSSFYREESQELKMTKLFTRVMKREMEDGTWVPRDRKLMNKSFGKEVKRNIGNN
ncbi:MAG: cobalamin-dependent protein [Bacteroidales bacterium]|nr:cobalamin-dependent protein [Bacteroidales bacterium]MDD4480648.1 cobalamin-dependent protein [Bacteroidales bacterium]MDD5313921.1 cobalamin-dependent protein [Bacteroidales bacterium]MDY0358622.1 cobalamin-dependent protein [Bacteroidales bacterium]